MCPENEFRDAYILTLWEQVFDKEVVVLHNNPLVPKAVSCQLTEKAVSIATEAEIREFWLMVIISYLPGLFSWFKLLIICYDNYATH